MERLTDFCLEKSYINSSKKIQFFGHLGQFFLKTKLNDSKGFRGLGVLGKNFYTNVT